MAWAIRKEGERVGGGSEYRNKLKYHKSLQMLEHPVDICMYLFYITKLY